MNKPLLETVDEREFTNREKEFKFLWQLVADIKIRQGASHAIISRKGVGKTVLLTSFYNILFTTQEKVIPFYLSFAEFKTGEQKILKLKEFIEYYFGIIISQFISFKLKQPQILSEIETYSFYQLKEFSQVHGLDSLAEVIGYYINMWQNEDYHKLLYFVIHFTYKFLGRQGEYGILMIDEFQVLTGIWDEEAARPRNITDIFQKTAEAKWCPMVVTGSAVYLISMTVFGGLLARRFNPYYLAPFNTEHTVEYAFKLATIKSIKITEEVAIEIHYLSGGNPFYIWCLMNSYGIQNQAITTLASLLKVYHYEMENSNGKLKGFWWTHFREYARQINSKGLAIYILYHLATHPQGTIHAKQLAELVGTNWQEVEEVIDQLEQADLVDREFETLYHRIQDPVLADYVAKRYKVTIEQQSLTEYIEEFERDFKRKIGSLSRLLGETAELYTRHLLLSFKGQKINSEKVFGVPGEEITLPEFTTVEKRGGMIMEGDIIEFDLIAEGTELWLVEVKYWKKPVSIQDVEQFIEKVQKYNGWTVPPTKDRRLWFFSKAGFRKEARKKLQQLGLWHSDIHGFNLLCQAVGIGMLPLFEKKSE